MSRWIKCLKTLDISGLWEETRMKGCFLTEKYNLVSAYTVKGADITKLNLHFEAPLDMPLSKVKESWSIWFLVEERVEDNVDNNAVQIPNAITAVPKRNAFEILMSAQKSTVSSASLQISESLNNKDLLFNDVVLLLNDDVLGIHLESVRRLCKALTEGLWAIDSNHEQFNKAFVNNNCKKLPEYFSQIYHKQYFNYQSRKRAKPSLSQQKLSKCADELFDSLDLWSNISFKNEEFLEASRNLAEALLSYSQYLAKANKRMMENRAIATSSSVIIDKFALPNVVEAVVDASSLKKEYEKLNTFMDHVHEYDPIYLDNTGDIEDFGVRTRNVSAICGLKSSKSVAGKKW